jgi:phage terminase Nu1 subunit (DNA packaging protein)
MRKKGFYAVSAIAHYLNVSERRVQQLAQEGVIPAAEKGYYALEDSVRGYVMSLQARKEKKSLTPEIEKERLRLMRAQAQRAEDENNVRHGQLIDVGLAGDIFNDVAVLYAGCIEALPGRLADELTGLQDPAVVKSKLYDACCEIRQATVRCLLDFTESIRVARSLYEKDSGSVAEDTEPVGG